MSRGKKIKREGFNKPSLVRGFRVGGNDEPAPCVPDGVIELGTFAHGDGDVPAQPDCVEGHQVGGSVGRDEGDRDRRRLSCTHFEFVRYCPGQVMAPVAQEVLYSKEG